ncbi:MAG: RNA-processing protein [Candidatus Micrarchaeota archaeon]|nr:RNA-processing protein [Candidatus Micrarchaeota archaeon]
MITSLLVPEERVKILRMSIPEIEKATETKIRISGNEVFIEGEGLGLFTAERILKAISRGFEPERAMKLLEEGNELEIIKIPAKDSGLVRIRSRIIGTRGRAKRKIEETTGCMLAIYGKTVSIIGKYPDIEKAKKAVEMLIRGSPHPRVYRFLSKNL